MIKRELLPTLRSMLSKQAAVALLGPRQVGKTTLALQIAKTTPSIYIDLGSPSDKQKISDPELYLSQHQDKLVIIDEIQRAPDLFKVLRGLIDQARRKGKRYGKFLILGSASLELLKQSSESLAGRIAYLDLGVLNPIEVKSSLQLQKKLWLRGGFPESYLAKDNLTSFEWRLDFIKTYLERDIPQLGPRIPAETLKRFWTMLAHNQGDILNAAKLASALSVSGQTIARYLDLMVDLLLVRRLQPWFMNTKKRMIKSPKIYVRDSGLIHALLGIEDEESLLGHPVAGTSWEGFVIESLLSLLPRHYEGYFYRTSSGSEIDLVLKLPKNHLWAIEIKRSLAPKLEKGFYNSFEDIKPDEGFVVYPGEEQYRIANNITVINYLKMVKKLKKVRKARTK